MLLSNLSKVCVIMDELIYVYFNFFPIEIKFKIKKGIRKRVIFLNIYSIVVFLHNIDY